MKGVLPNTVEIFQVQLPSLVFHGTVTNTSEEWHKSHC